MAYIKLDSVRQNTMCPRFLLRYIT